MKYSIAIGLVLVSAGVASCGLDQMAARTGWGNQIINLQCGQKLLTAEWKDNTMWYLTTPLVKDDIPRTLKFSAKTVTGFMEGKVDFIESICVDKTSDNNFPSKRI